MTFVESSCLIIASNFPPIQSAGVYRTLRMAKYLPALGWKLNILTLSTNTLQQGTSIDPALLDQIPTDIQIYRAPARFPIEKLNRILGRNRQSAKEKVALNGITGGGTTTGKMPKKSSAGFYQRLKDQLTLPWMTPDRMVGWVGPAAKLGTVAVRESETNVIYSSGPPWSNHLVAVRIVAATGLPWVADFRDPWGGNAFRPGRSGDTWAGRKHRELESRVYRNASVVIFNTDRSRSDAVDRIGESLANKSVVIPNGFDPAHFEGLDLSSSSPDTVKPASEPLQIIHAGSFYGKRNVDSLLSAIGELKRAGKLSAADVQLSLIGRVREHEQTLVKQHSIRDIVALEPPVSHHDCLQRLRDADLLLLVQTEAPLCIPGKLYEYIAIGKPVLTVASDGATADLVAAESIGECIAPTDITGLKICLLDLVDRHRNGGIKRRDVSVRNRYDGSRQMELFDTVLRRAMVDPETRSAVGVVSE